MILVGDPVRTTADLMVRRLRADGFHALGFATGPGVLGRLAENDVEAVIVDPALASGQLASIIALIRAAAPGTPIIAFGTGGSADDAANAKALGASEYFVKGRLTPRELVDKLTALVSQRRADVKAPTMPNSYYVRVQAGDDVARISQDLGVAPGLRCNDCGSQLSLYLQRDPARLGKWLFGTFGCLVCATKGARVEPEAGSVDQMPELELVMGGAR